MQDANTIYGLAGAIIILAVLVYLMYKEGSSLSWKQQSAQAKQKIRGE